MLWLHSKKTPDARGTNPPVSLRLNPHTDAVSIAGLIVLRNIPLRPKLSALTSCISPQGEGLVRVPLYTLHFGGAVCQVQSITSPPSHRLGGNHAERPQIVQDVFSF